MTTSLKQRIEALALDANMDCVGIAPAERLQNEPPTQKPTDFLPSAQSVVSMGMNINLGVQISHKMAYRHQSRPQLYVYLWYAFWALNMRLDRAAHAVARLIEDEDPSYIAVPIPSGSTFDLRRSITDFSCTHAAVAAGLGELGLNGFVLNPKVGPAARYVSVITNAKLDPSPMYQGPKLCDPEKCKQACLDVCPTHALGPDIKKILIGGASFDVAKLDTWRCLWASMGLSKETFSMSSIPMPDKLEFDDIAEALAKRARAQIHEISVIGRGDYCGKCIIECPVGSKRITEAPLK